jgi:hypothetical protein
MNAIKNLFVKLIGNRLDADLTKWKISKAKVAFVLTFVVTAYNMAAPSFGYPVVPQDAIYMLGVLGLWAVRDAIKPSEEKS